MPVGTAKLHDPRVQLIREKYFSVRPKPLERWLWSKNVPASAERVFWLHWQEGQLRGDWCSEIPLRRVAQECNLDVSTVTRAYQCLTRLGCIRRTDPGRDATNPFQQATAITEVRIPRELLQVLHQYPNRRSPTERNEPAEPGRAHNPNHSAAHESQCSTAIPQASSASQEPHSSNETATAAVTSKTENRGLLNPTESPSSATEPLTAALKTALAIERMTTQPFPTTALTTEPLEASTLSPTPQPESPLATLTGRDRAKAIAEITALLSATERDAYHQSLRLHLPTMSFDPDSKVSTEKRAFLIQALVTLATDSHTPGNASANTESPSATQTPKAPQRKLSLFHVARLKRDIQSATSSSAAPELLRQVVWSIEAGALRRFSPLHALNIALKKIRAGSWTRPHRMPPNWARSLSTPTLAAPTPRTASPHETCSVA
jgi:hypothetical protein